MVIEDNRPLRMAELVDASGVHRQTIHSYLREGILPGPEQNAGTARARYGARHLALLRLVRELRDRGMSLEAIRRCFEGASFDPDQVRRMLSGPAIPPGSPLEIADREPGDGATLAAEAGCPERWVDTLAEAGVVTPLPDGRFDRQVVDLLSVTQRLLDDGMPQTSVLRICRLARGVGGVEASALISDITDAAEDTETAVRRAEQRLSRITELSSAVRLHAVRQVMQRVAEVGSRSLTFARDAIYVPSELFIERYGLDGIIAALEHAALQEPERPDLWKRLGQVLLGVGRYDEAEVWLARSAERTPDDAATHTYLGLARAISGRTEAGVTSARRATEIEPQSPRAHAFLGVTLALHATSAATAAEAADVLRQAIRTAADSHALIERDVGERMETLLARGRLLTVLPSDQHLHQQGVADLEEVLTRTAHAADEDIGFELPGSGDLYRMHALFYLGISAWYAGERARTRRMLQECITIDPASHFARRSYEILTQLGDAPAPNRGVPDSRGVQAAIDPADATKQIDPCSP